MPACPRALRVCEPIRVLHFLPQFLLLGCRRHPSEAKNLFPATQSPHQLNQHHLNPFPPDSDVPGGSCSPCRPGTRISSRPPSSDVPRRATAACSWLMESHEGSLALGSCSAGFVVPSRLVSRRDVPRLYWEKRGNFSGSPVLPCLSSCNGERLRLPAGRMILTHKPSPIAVETQLLGKHLFKGLKRSRRG